MTDKEYLKIVSHYTKCFREHGDTHLGLDWPNREDLFTRYEVMLQLQRSIAPCSILDFGCGTAMLQQYILENKFDHILYSGLDLGEEYVSRAQEKFPSVQFYNTNILTDENKLPSFDYIVMNGVITEKCSLTYDEMWNYTQQLLKAVFAKSKIGIAFNLMSSAVDWERGDLFHMKTDTLINFMVSELSRHFIIRNDYDLYEYTVYLYHAPCQK